LSAGIGFQEIECLTAKEIGMAVHAKQEQKTEFFQMMAGIAYKGAELTGIAVNDMRKFPSSVEDAFPKLFEKKGQDWRVVKERVGDYAKAKNKGGKERWNNSHLM
jgi:aspartokinase-like uncharacterized kinase